QPSYGDLKHIAGQKLLELARSGKKGLVIMNAKKETAYMFADILLALYEKVPTGNIKYIANLEPRGLPKVQNDSKLIFDQMCEHGIKITLCGSLDEYGEIGPKLSKIIANEKPDYILIVGVPHTVDPDILKDIPVFSVTNGPRQVIPLKEQGHDYVMVEIDLHPKTIGTRNIIESEFGAVLRSIT
ncbi:MAG TPA: Ni-sirohydrochlorin a,c-diamide reductive cyclase catalytic subunit, partial [Methanocorpusculum sp.]|nr:Ni-sirohydrochlorin a,c-diamide reductive cyclase catalytic subunit [Methanocorpusculum sp.]